jgi:hypothetical protein
MKIYAGIGSREIDSNTEDLLFRIGAALAKEGWTLYSGGASGSDFSFEKGCDKEKGLKTIFLPWKNFGYKWNRQNCDSDIIGPTEKALELARNLAKEYPEEYSGLLKSESQGKEWNWLFIARNMHQILGRKLLVPVNSVICYTKDAQDLGGTRWALRLARKYNVNIYNVGDTKTKEKFEKWLDKIKML